MAIMLWNTPEDAGRFEGKSTWDEFVHDAQCIREGATHAAHLTQSKAFLPENDTEKKGHSLDVFSSPSIPPQPEVQCKLCGTEGLRLTDVRTTWELFESIGHAMLGNLNEKRNNKGALAGWLTLYQEGYLHRGVSIDNILRLKTSEQRKFRVRHKFKRGAVHNDPQISKIQKRVKKQAKRLNSLVRELRFKNECIAVIVDGGMRMRLKDCFESPDSGYGVHNVSKEFMSEAIYNDNEYGDGDYIPSSLLPTPLMKL
ncbi:hypothetical protein AMATHDRAFT_51522 [Amanita thiersii Skay4041]|uniref:Uncharacterized protein n=1 Tax=Amanita thiersii Skay4041 TaxID=703135 RepID=A0A2A9NDI7_9AGAR|nr:hypothetical protein AMATHDRAFT_51522 [Amanita thiersii Skay4041]